MSFGLPTTLVNTLTLDLVTSHPLFETQCFNIPLRMAIVHQSRRVRDDTETHWGLGWCFSLDASIRVDTKNQCLVLRIGVGYELRFKEQTEVRQGPGAPILYRALGTDSGRLYRYEDRFVYEEAKNKWFWSFPSANANPVFLAERVTDIHGNTIQFLRNVNGSLRQITDPAGRSYLIQHHERQWVDALVLPDGREIRCQHDSFGRLIGITNSEGIQTRYAYDDRERLVRLTVGAKEKTTTLTYLDDSGSPHIHSVTDRNGGVTVYQKTDPVTTTVTHPNGQTTTYMGKDGLTERVRYADGSELLTGYENRMPVFVQNPLGHVTRFTWDANRRLRTRVDPLGNATRYEYDEAGNQVLTVNPLGHETRLQVDGKGDIVRTILPDGSSTSYIYDERGQVRQVVLPGGRTLSLTYDRFGNLLQLSDSMGVLHQVQYDELGLRETASTDSNGSITQYLYDGLDRIRTIVHPDGSRTEQEYDCCAGILSRDGLGSTTLYERDAMSRILGEINPMGQATRYQRDEAGNIVRVSDPLGHSEQFQRDALGRMTQRIDSLGAVTSRTYDANGSLQTITDAKQNRYVFTRDATNRVVQMDDGTGIPSYFGYDAVGRPQFLITQRMNKLSFTYDCLGRIQQKCVDEVPVADFSYSTSGVLSALAEAEGLTRFERDVRDQITAIVYADGSRFSFERDPNGQVCHVGYPDGDKVLLKRNKMGRVVEVVYGKHSIRREYDAAGRLCRILRSNGTESTFSYDEAGQPLSVCHVGRHSECHVLARFAYRYDLAGNMSGSTDEIPFIHSGEDEQTADLDMLSIEDRTCQYGPLNRLVAVEGRPCQYDADGNCVSLHAGVPLSFAYDTESRVTRKQNPEEMATYRYNALGWWIGGDRGTCSYRRYPDDQGQTWMESSAEGKKHRYLVVDHQVEAVVDEQGDIFFYHHDARGNVAVISNEAGEAVCAYAYSPYGEILKKCEIWKDNRYTFLGEYGVADEGDGCYLTPQRMYHAPTCRFLQPDPMRFMEDLNLYAYARQNPLKFMDPEGTIPFLIPVIIVGGYIAYKVVDVTKKAVSSKESIQEYNSSLTKLEKARIKRDGYFKWAPSRPWITEDMLYRVEMEYRDALLEAANQAAATGKKLVWEYGVNTYPFDELGGSIKEISCRPPSEKRRKR